MDNNKNYEAYWKASNYINLYYQNYLRYQRSSRNSSERVHVSSIESNINAYFDQLTKRELASIATNNTSINQHRKKIEDQLNFFFSSRNRKSNLEERKVWEKIVDKAIEIMNKNKKGAKLIATDDTYDKLKLAVNNSAALQQNEIREKAKGFVTNIYNYQTTIERIIKAIEQDKNNIVKSGNISEQKLNRLLEMWKIETKKLEEQQFGSKGARFYAKSFGQKSITQLSDSAGNIMSYGDYATELQRIYTQSFSTSSYWSGQLAEIVSSIIGFSLQSGINLTLKNIDKALEKYNVNKGVVGGKTTPKAYDFSKFGDNLLGKTDSKFWQEVLKGTDYTVGNKNSVAWSQHASQDKVDITFTIKNTQDVINASVKNYNLGVNSLGKIGLVSGARTLMLVQGYQEFLTHYLNITQRHPEPPLKSDTIDHQSLFNLNPSHYQASGKTIKKAHNTMKSLLAIKALAGGTLGANLTKNKQLSGGKKGPLKNTSMANLFIVNDNSKGGFKVYTVDYLYAWINKNIEQLIFEGYPENKEHLYTLTDWDSEIGRDMGGTKRMKDLYRQLHNQKLKISMPSTALKA